MTSSRKPHEPLPLEARRALWERLWERLLQTDPSDREAEARPPADSSPPDWAAADDGAGSGRDRRESGR